MSVVVDIKPRITETLAELSPTKFVLQLYLKEEKAG